MLESARMGTSPRGPRSEDEPEQLDATKASRSLWRGLIQVALLVALGVGLLFAVPGLESVGDVVTGMQVSWIVVAIVLEILSCASYIVVFLWVFDRVPLRFGARVALSELAFGAAVSLGGAGSVAIGAWLLVERGANSKRVAERSAVLFLLTSAINVITLVLAGLALGLGIVPGKRNPLLTIVPAAVGIAVLVVFFNLPRIADWFARRRAPGRLHTLLTETAYSIRLTRELLLSPDWRLLGAIGYLWFDIAALVACFAAAGRVPGLAPLVLAYLIGYISNLIPIPGNVGILDGSLVGMFVLYGTPATFATAAVVVYHAIALWIPALWGTLAFLLLQRSRGEPVRLRPPRRRRRRTAPPS